MSFRLAILLSEFYGVSLARLAPPGNFEPGHFAPGNLDDPETYSQSCSRSSDCNPPEGRDLNVGCDRKTSSCKCRSGYMDADNDPANGCELPVQDKICRFGTCKDHAVIFGEECGNWGGRLICSGNAHWSCCVKTETFVEGTVWYGMDSLLQATFSY